LAIPSVKQIHHRKKCSEEYSPYVEISLSKVVDILSMISDKTVQNTGYPTIELMMELQMGKAMINARRTEHSLSE
jgi:hypothetical protein